MSLRLLGLEHVADGYAVGALDSGCGLQYLDVGYAPYHPTTTGKISHWKVGKEILFGRTVAGAYGGWWTMPMTKFFPTASPTKVVVGFKLKQLAVPLVATNPFSLATSTSTAPITASVVAQLTTSAAIGSIDGYYEIEMDFTNSKWNIYVDDVLKSTAALPSGVSASTIRNLFWCCGHNATTSVSGGTVGDIYYKLSDIYVSANYGTSDDLGRLGPIRLNLLPAASVDQNVWTPSGATDIVTTLNNKRVDTNSLQTPYLTTDAANTPLRIKSSVVNIADKETIVAIGSELTAWETAAANLLSKWAYNGVDGTVNTYVVPTTTPAVQVQAGNAIAKLPGGVTITKTALAAAEFVLTPA